MRFLLPVLAVIQIACYSADARILSSYGVKAGIAVTNHDFDYTWFPVPKWDNRIGISVAGFAEWFELSFFSVVTEARYVQRGMVCEAEGRDINNMPTGIFRLDNRLDYLSISVLAKASFGSPSITPFFTAGPRMDILLGFSAESHGPVYEEFEPVDIGGDIGAGAEFQIANLPVFTSEFRYNLYFTDSYETDLLTVRNQSIEILLGIKF
jgi:hypothetical protein